MDHPTDPGPDILIVSAARVWTAPGATPRPLAIALSPRGVLALGPLTDLRQRFRSAEILDAGDATIVPGFVDAHAHVRACASARLAHDAGSVRSIAELLALAAGAAVGPGDWVSLAGLQPESLAEGHAPTVTELDSAVRERPLRVRHRSLHAWLLNSAGRAQAGLAPDLGATWVEDHDGWLHERLGAITPTLDLEAAVAGWSLALLRQGVTAVVDATATNRVEDVSRLARWQAAGVIRQTVAAFTATPIGAAGRSAGCKLLVPPGPSFEARLAAGLRDGWRWASLVALHCPDVETLGALVAALADAPPPPGRRLRLEHASVVPPEWLGTFARLPVTVVTHPAFVRAHGDRYLREPDLPAEWLYRLRSWLAAGVPLAFGSDQPAGPGDPLVALAAAVDRRATSGAVIGDTEALAPGEALAGLTAWAADASGLTRHGRLAEGSVADLVILEGDPFEPEGAAHLAVRTVVRAGRPVPGSAPARTS